MPQLELGRYPTQRITTSGSTVTRLAPSPVIPNFIPSTGYIAGWVDMVKDITKLVFEGATDPTEANGEYHIDGTEGGKPAYTNGGHWIWWEDDGDAWIVTDTKGSGTYLFGRKDANPYGIYGAFAGGTGTPSATEFRACVFSGDVQLYVDNDKFKGEIYGETFEFDIPFTWDDYEREKFGFILSWSETNLYLDILHGTTLTRETEAEAITATANRDLDVGHNDGANHTSVYFHSLVAGTQEEFTEAEARVLLKGIKK